ncbi:MAG: adenylate/guanylate cyclase domain-containing protein [Deltaproteobacteria bacterium]|nr:adenylate/guanylate cyclase domain-containing protein [Deltaproteobacteria bacterium]
MVRQKSPLGDLQDLAEAMDLSPRHTREWVFGALLAAAIFAAVLVAGGAGWLERPENFYYGLWHRLAGQRYQPQNVVIVAVDDDTLAEHPDVPLVCWTPLFAQVLHRLRELNVRIIGLDYLYYVSIESWLRRLKLPGSDISRTFDLPFRRELGTGQVMMAATLGLDEDGRRVVNLPIVDYYFSLPQPRYDVGLVNFYTDPDNVIRRYLPAMIADPEVLPESIHHPGESRTTLSFSQLLAARFQGREAAAEIKRLEEHPHFPDWNAASAKTVRLEAFPLIGFAGPPRTFSRVSFRRLLGEKKVTPSVYTGEFLGEMASGEAGSVVGAVWGKIAIVANEPSAMQDVHPTPYSQHFLGYEGEDMSGAEIHANIVETLLTDRFPRPVGRTWTLFYLGLALMGALVLFFRLSIWQGLASGPLLCLAVAGLSYLSFRSDLLLPAAPVQAAISLGYVGVLMIRLTGEERERTHIRQLFGRYVSDEVVERLLASGRRPDLGGEALTVTVLFSDIRGFTSMSEKLNARQVVEMLNAYFTRACEPILEEGGTVDKFIGDAVMAIFGAPVPYPDHPRRAVRAALALARMAQDFRPWMEEHFPESDLPPFSIGIGLHVGEAVVGNIGSPKRLEFTSIGDTVNLASRLESATKELGWTIVASRDIITAVGPGLLVGGQASLQLKGKKDPVEVFEILGLEDE